jgi:HPt (histidine-containing phosphotransfer) domain-containing protein
MDVDSESVDDLLRRLRPSFLESVQRQLAEMEEAIQDSDMQRLAYLSHRLKGAGGGYGFPQISQICSRLESEVKSSASSEAIQHQFQKLKTNYQLLSKDGP